MKAKRGLRESQGRPTRWPIAQVGVALALLGALAWIAFRAWGVDPVRPDGVASQPPGELAHGTFDHQPPAARSGAEPPGGNAPTLEGAIGPLHHAIRTTNQEAQRLFDQGLTLYYGFSRDAARRSFERASTLDPDAPMAHVGIALALGPNLNVDSTADERRRACRSAGIAQARARQAEEWGFARAMAVRYCGSDETQGAVAYASAMRALIDEPPGNSDAAALYVDSLMALRRRTDEQTAEILDVLESVLRRDPNHVGANHYYIHIVEGSSRPERALPSARRLEALVPSVGHLLHMPSHIHLRLGDYGAAVASNLRAVQADRVYLRANSGDREYGIHFEHALESLAVAAGFVGRFDVALEAANEAAGIRSRGVSGATQTDRFSPTLVFVLLRFQRWPAILLLPAPHPSDQPSTLWYHFARAIAYAVERRITESEAEQAAFDRTVRAIPPEAVYRSNPAAAVLDVYSHVIRARLAWARNDVAASVDAWERAASAEDALAYHEPPPVYYPTRESLGAALFASGRYAEAERVFRADLQRHPRNGRSLFGLAMTLERLGRGTEAESARREFAAVWPNDGAELSLSRF